MNYKNLKMEELQEWFSDMDFKTDPYKHQLASLAFTLGESHKQVMLTHDIGTGKTLTALYLIQCWNVLGKILIICPNSVISTWKKEIEQHTDYTYTVLDGTKKERMHKLDHAKTNIYIINYEGLKVLFAEKAGLYGKKIKYAIGSKFSFEAVIADECHRFKNPKALQTRVAHFLSMKTRYSILMTGTPIAHSAQDLFGQYLVLNNGKTFGTEYYWFLKNYFFQPSYGFGWEPKKICNICNELFIGKKKHLDTHKISLKDYRLKYGKDKTTEDIILKKASEYTIRYSREECLDLPEKIYQVREVLPTKLQTDTLEQLLLGIEFKDIPVHKLEYHMQKLIQVTSGIILDKGELKYEFKQNPKLNDLGEILPEITDKFILYHQYIHEGKMLEQFLTKQKIKHTSINGSKNNQEKEQAIETFTNTDCQCLVAHPKSGGEGLNLQCANTEIFYSNSMIGNILREQAEGRIHRAGQTKTCLYIDVVMVNTIDEILYYSLKNKTDYAKSILKYLQKKHK